MLRRNQLPTEYVRECFRYEDGKLCYINEWYDFGEVAKIIYDGGGRINKHMDTKRSK